MKRARVRTRWVYCVHREWEGNDGHLSRAVVAVFISKEAARRHVRKMRKLWSSAYRHEASTCVRLHYS